MRQDGTQFTTGCCCYITDATSAMSVCVCTSEWKWATESVKRGLEEMHVCRRGETGRKWNKVCVFSACWWIDTETEVRSVVGDENNRLSWSYDTQGTDWAENSYMDSRGTACREETLVIEPEKQMYKIRALDMLSVILLLLLFQNLFLGRGDFGTEDDKISMIPRCL